MGAPIAHNGDGICFAYPNVCLTPAPSGQVAVPYPSIGQLKDADPCTDTVFVKGNAIITRESEISSTSGDESGSGGGVTSKTQGGKVEFTSWSKTVFAQGSEIVRSGDRTKQNDGNAVGTVLGGERSVLVGG